MTTELTTEQGPVAGRTDALVKDILIVASDANELLKEKLDAAGSSLGEARTVLTEKVRTAAMSSSDYVKGHPWKVFGLATAVGVIVGILAWRR
ncbi:MAG: hypothetical protein Q8M20_04050 [Rhodocyclaceae bacterium]|nr:hypothetical protein [Rhodocyclaceae bacterium]MDZ4213930.1 hypothetical protein [Rhodocyclaceae bacterium]